MLEKSVSEIIHLLNTLSTNVANGMEEASATGNLVNFIKEDNPLLRPLHIEVGVLQEFGYHWLNVLAHVARLRQRGAVTYGEGHIQTLC